MADNSRPVQRIILWTTLAALATLAVLSIVGALQPGDHPEVKAAELFNSAPMVVYWFLLAGLLLAGILTFKRLAHSPGALAGHLGAVLVLVGAMAGSARWNAISNHSFKAHKVRSGAMALNLGEPTSEVMDKATHLESNLPFQLVLEKFWIEYYPQKKTDWELWVEAQVPGHDSEAATRQKSIDWAVGMESPIPFTNGTIKVLQYFPHAAPVYDSNVQPSLAIIQADGNRLLLPAKADEETSLADSNLVVRIVRVFSHLSVVENGEAHPPGEDSNLPGPASAPMTQMTPGKGMQVVDDPDSPGPPAIEIRVGPPGDPGQRAFVSDEGVIMHSPKVPPLDMRYVQRQISGAAPASQGPPAMQFRLTLGDTQGAYWFVPFSAHQPAMLPLDEQQEAAPAQSGHGATGPAPQAFLYLVPPVQEPKAYKSKITVLENGQPVDTQIVQVNEPLHYGGYHFTQDDYDKEGGQYTVLGVHSDSGLYVVYAGFALMLLGVCWVLWLRPVDKTSVDGEQAVYRVVRLGFPLLTLGLILGAWWGKLAWGDYWGWDPKELWGLVSWLVFLGYLHWRCMNVKRALWARVGPGFLLFLAITMVGGGLYALLFAWLRFHFSGNVTSDVVLAGILIPVFFIPVFLASFRFLLRRGAIEPATAAFLSIGLSALLIIALNLRIHSDLLGGFFLTDFGIWVQTVVAGGIFFASYFFLRRNGTLFLAVVGLLAVVATLIMVNTGMHAYSGPRGGMNFKPTTLGCLIMGAIFAYVLAAVAMVRLKNGKAGMSFFTAGFLLALAAVITRWIEVGHLPLQSLFEVFLFLGMLAMPISLFCRLFLGVGGAFLDAALGIIVLFPAAFVFPAEPQQLPPALRSWLFAPHVGAYMLAYVVLAKAGLLALGQIFRRAGKPDVKVTPHQA